MKHLSPNALLLLLLLFSFLFRSIFILAENKAISLFIGAFNAVKSAVVK